MIERFIGQIPFWARRDHPVLRYELQKNAPKTSFATRYVRALFSLLVGGGLLLLGVIVATRFFSYPAGQHPVEAIYNVLLVPLIALQILVQISAFLMTSGVVGEKARAGNWDNLRAAEHGAALTLRARWASIFYRMRGLFGVIFILRIVLIGTILYSLTSFQGRHLDLFIVGITPAVALPIAVMLLAFTMTATLLLPFTSAGFDAGLGVLVSSFVRQRVYLTLIQVIYLSVHLAILILFGFILTLPNAAYSDAANWFGLLGHAAFGVGGLSFLSLARYGEIWASVPFGIFLGLALLIFTLAQAALTDLILSYAARRAQGRE